MAVEIQSGQRPEYKETLSPLPGAGNKKENRTPGKQRKGKKKKNDHASTHAHSYTHTTSHYEELSYISALTIGTSPEGLGLL